MKKWIWIATPLVALVLGVMALFAYLTPALPTPSGPELVGYDRFAVEKGERWVDVQAFYPAAAKSNQQLEAMPSDLAKQLALSFGAPHAAMIDERVIPAYIQAPIKPGSHPVLMFNHGHGMFATQNSHQVLELVSHGYIVLALNHPGHSLLSKNGDQIATRGAGIANYTPEEASTLLQRQVKGNDDLRAATSRDEWIAVMEGIQKDAFYDIVDQFPEWIANNQMVLDALPDIQSGAIKTALAANMDLSRIAYFGHSFGGAVATHMGMQDSRIKAAYNLDGPVFTWSLTESPTAQFCFAYANASNQENVALDFSWANQQVAKSVAGCETVFDGAAHMNFSDLNEMSFLRWLNLLGPIDGTKMRNNLNASLLSFFDQHLRNGAAMPKLDGTEMIQH